MKDSRAGMVRSAASLMSTRGASATSFSDVLADSGAPRGSIYHHFPDGKKQLTADAVRWTGQRLHAYMEQVPARAPADVLAAFIDMWRQVVARSGGAAGCAIAGAAVDTTPEEPELMAVIRDAFRSWTEVLARRFEASGLSAIRATSMAVSALAGMEGALILCRAEGDAGPLEIVAAGLMDHLCAIVGD